jgi:hypothetical protein
LLAVDQDDLNATRLQVQCSTDADNPGAQNDGLAVHEKFLVTRRAGVG